MKTKRLALNKTTIANLNGTQMRRVYAGQDQKIPVSGASCPICEDTWDCPITSTVTYYTCNPCPVINDPVIAD
jgi:hypothetical protein